MARIPLPDSTDPSLEPKSAAIMGAVKEAFGVDYNVIKALANHGDLLEAFIGLQTVAYTSRRLEPAQTEIAYYTAAVANSCHY